MPVYEYCCPFHGVWEKLTRSIPDSVPRELPCPEMCTREKGQEHVCKADSMIVPSLGFYGEAKMGTVGRLSRKQRRYHEQAPEREAKERRERVGRSKKPLTRDQVQEYERTHATR